MIKLAVYKIPTFKQNEKQAIRLKRIEENWYKIHNYVAMLANSAQVIYIVSTLQIIQNLLGLLHS